jgi:hypothetical protein
MESGLVLELKVVPRARVMRRDWELPAVRIEVKRAPKSRMSTTALMSQMGHGICGRPGGENVLEGEACPGRFEQSAV